MIKLLILTLLALPAAAAAQSLSTANLDEAAPAAAAADPDAAEVLKRPDAPAVMAELSTALRLSSKQEERISAAINKKTREFDKLMKEYEKNSAEERKWRTRTNESRYGMLKINRGMPDLVREYLDDEQRDTFDRLVEARRKPAPAPAELAPAAGGQAPKPAKKRRLVRRKKLKGAAGAKPGLSQAAAEEAGGVMVDKDAMPNSQPPEPRKKAVKKRPITKGAPPADEYNEQLEGADNAGQSRPAVEEEEEGDAGSYP